MSFTILDEVSKSGITFLDMADTYPIGADPTLRGRTEELVGRWLKGRREEFIVATKGNAQMGPRPWNRGNSRKHIIEAVEASLRRLNTDYVDLYQLHHPDPNTPPDETLRALDDLVRAGKIRYIGCSNFLAYQIARATGRSEFLSLVRFESVQVRYNLLFREVERELLSYCQEDQIAVNPYNPLAGGFLSGSYTPNTELAGTRFSLGSAGAAYRGRYWRTEMFETVDSLRAVAREAGISLVQMAIAWLLANPAITAPIIGADHPDQLEPSLRALGDPMESDLKARLDQLTAKYR